MSQITESNFEERILHAMSYKTKEARQDKLRRIHSAIYADVRREVMADIAEALIYRLRAPD